jgi:hypothetical protein
MQTECHADLFGFARVEGRATVARSPRRLVRCCSAHRWAAPIDRALCGLRTSVRRIKLAMPTAFPYQAEYHAALTAAVTV